MRVDPKVRRKIAERHAAAKDRQSEIIARAKPPEADVEANAKALAAMGGALKALPGDFTMITVTATFVDLAGAAVVGTVTFTPSYTNTFDDEADLIQIVPITLTATLIAGAMSIQLPATDDPDIQPTGWSYLVTYKFTGFTQSYSIEVPYNTPGGVLDLSTANPVTPNVDLDAFVTFGDMQAAIDDAIANVFVISDTPPDDITAIWIDTSS